MKEVIWVSAIALLALPGTIVWNVPLVARMSRGARWALAFIAGLLIAALLLYAYALVGVQWSRVNIGIPLIALAIWSSAIKRGADVATTTAWPLQSRIIIALFLAVTVYAIADTRATCGDLVYIWAPKAQAFYSARTIDPKFLSFVFYNLMHPDYPPLVPLTYDAGSIFAHDFSLWPPLFLAPLILLAIIGTLRGFGAPPAAAALVMAVLSFAFVSAYLPGGADPFLLLFESVALIALTFAPESTDARWIAAAALAGAAFSKVEGATFAIVVAIAFTLTERRILRAIALVIPAAALLATWLLFASHHQLLDQYARARSPLYWAQLPNVVSGVWDRASYHAFWLPWLAAAAPLVVATARRRVALPLLAAAGSLGATIFFYIHNAQPALWIATSADRILVTPLMCIAVASASTWDSIGRVSSRAP